MWGGEEEAYGDGKMESEEEREGVFQATWEAGGSLEIKLVGRHEEEKSQERGSISV